MKTLLVIASVLTLLALALMVWSLLQPTPLPVMVAMSAGQVLGTAALGAYIYVVVKDLFRLRRERAEQDKP